MGRGSIWVQAGRGGVRVGEGRVGVGKGLTWYVEVVQVEEGRWV